MRIGEAAARTGVNADTLRYYEREGILPQPPRTERGYRVYTDSMLNRIAFVRRARLFGFSIKQLAAFLRARDAGRPPCRDVRTAAERLLADVDRRIDELTAARRAMQETLAEWDRRLAATPDGMPARLLETLIAR
jgi:DNA-binding transcriptional MerR regulator